MHVRGLPALHHGFTHDLQVCVGFIVAGVSVMPGGFAVLSLRKNRLSSGGHVVLIRRRLWLLFGSGERFGRLCLHTEEGERQEAAIYIGLRSADTAGGPRQVNILSQRRNCGAQDPLQRRRVTQQQRAGSCSSERSSPGFCTNRKIRCNGLVRILVIDMIAFGIWP